MSITRKQLADTIDEYDQQITDLQKGKRETYQSYREELTATAGKDAAKAEIEAFKVALKRRQAVAKKGEEVVEDKDALADEIFVEITAARAPRATRTRESDLVTTRIQNNSGALEPKTGVSSTAPDPHTNTARETLASTTAADPAGDADDASSADQAEPSDAAVTEGNDLREPLAAAAGQILREGDAPLKADAHVIGEVLLQQVEHPESNSEPGKGTLGAKPSMASEPATEEGTGPQPSSVVPGRQPGCLNPDTCAGTWRKRCATCERAFMAVAAGGQAIVHQGQVA